MIQKCICSKICLYQQRIIKIWTEVMIFYNIYTSSTLFTATEVRLRTKTKFNWLFLKMKMLCDCI